MENEARDLAIYLLRYILVPCLRNLFLDIGNLRYLEVSTE